MTITEYVSAHASCAWTGLRQSNIWPIFWRRRLNVDRKWTVERLALQFNLFMPQHQPKTCGVVDARLSVSMNEW